MSFHNGSYHTCTIEYYHTESTQDTGCYDQREIIILKQFFHHLSS